MRVEVKCKGCVANVLILDVSDSRDINLVNRTILQHGWKPGDDDGLCPDCIGKPVGALRPAAADHPNPFKATKRKRTG